MSRAGQADGTSLPGLGHNNGPTMEPGAGWRRHCWTKARRDLMPRLPLEIVRRRLKRAAEIGLDYSTYATLHATGGDDIVAILFSSNALRLLKSGDRVPPDRQSKVEAIRRCDRILLAVPPQQAAPLAARIKSDTGLVFESAADGPRFPPRWAEMRAAMQRALQTRPAGDMDAPLGQSAHQRPLPPRAVLLVGDTSVEREWSVAGRLAGYLPSATYFDKE